MNPTNTVIVEVITSLGEYKAYSSAITALAKKPTMPAISKILIHQNGFPIFLVKTSKKSIGNSVITDIIFFIQ